VSWSLTANRERFTGTRHSDIVHPVSSSRLTETRDRVRSFGGYNTNPQDVMSTESLVNLVTATPQGPHKLALILSQKAKQLLAMDRYERRGGVSLRSGLSMRQKQAADAASQ
jgi:predicted Zn-dependent protease